MKPTRHIVPRFLFPLLFALFPQGGKPKRGEAVFPHSQLLQENGYVTFFAQSHPSPFFSKNTANRWGCRCTNNFGLVASRWTLLRSYFLKSKFRFSTPLIFFASLLTSWGLRNDQLCTWGSFPWQCNQSYGTIELVRPGCQPKLHISPHF